MAAYVLNCFWLVKSKSWFLILSHMVIVKSHIMNWRSDKYSSSDAKRRFPYFLSNLLSIRHSKKFNYIIIWYVLKSVSLIKIFLSQQEFHFLVRVNIMHEFLKYWNDPLSNLNLPSSNKIVLSLQSLSQLNQLTP